MLGRHILCCYTFSDCFGWLSSSFDLCFFVLLKLEFGSSLGFDLSLSDERDDEESMEWVD